MFFNVFQSNFEDDLMAVADNIWLYLDFCKHENEMYAPCRYLIVNSVNFILACTFTIYYHL